MASIIKADTLQSTTSNVSILNSAGTEYARFDSTGNFQLANPTTFPAGTAAAPSITATGDTNTGLYFPAADTIGFVEGGVEAMRIDSSGRVGIGTTPSGSDGIFTVSINSIGFYLGYGASYDNYYTAGSSGAQIFRNGNTERMRIDSSGNVGIGTSSPGSKLDINRGSAGLIANFTDGVNTNFQIGTSSLLATIGPSAGSTSMAFKTGDTERMRILSTGTFLFSGASGATTAEATGTITTYANGSGPYVSHNIDGQGNGFTFNIFKRLGTQVGNIVYNGSGVTFTTTSDYRLKENVRPATNVLDRVAKLKPCLFNWKESGSEELGFIAHELQEEFPHAVAGQKDAVETYLDDEGNEQTRIKPQGIDTSFLVATLTAAIQEQQVLITQLQADVAALKA